MDRMSDIRYGVPLIDDIHRYFPALLYDNRRFLSVRDVFTYINQQMDTNFNVYNRGSLEYRNTLRERGEDDRRGAMRQQQPQPHPVDPRVQQTAPVNVAPLQRQETVPIDNSLLRINYADPLRLHFTRPLSFVNPTPLTNLAVLQALFEEDSMEEPDDVIVAPTQEQINFGTTVYAVSGNQNGVCAICQDGFVEGQNVRRITGCNHEFHRGCIDIWFQRNVHCPVCRYDVRDISSEESTQ